MASELVPASASVASTGLGLRYIGTDPMHCYAYSGEVQIGGSSTADTHLLSFTTGSPGYIVAKYQMTIADNGASNLYLVIKLNGEIIMSDLIDGASSTEFFIDLPYYLIFPPQTKVEVLAGWAASATNFTGFLTGRVYGAV